MPLLFALSQNEFIVMGSKFPITIFTYHNPIFFLFTREGNLTPRQNKARMLLTKFSNLQHIHTAGTNITIADMLSRDFPTINNETCHFQHKTLPPRIDFLQLKNDNILKPIHYLIIHEDVNRLTFNQFYYIPHLPFWFSIFIHDCIECQTNKN